MFLLHGRTFSVAGVAVNYGYNSEFSFACLFFVCGCACTSFCFWMVLRFFFFFYSINIKQSCERFAVVQELRCGSLLQRRTALHFNGKPDTVINFTTWVVLWRDYRPSSKTTRANDGFRATRGSTPDKSVGKDSSPFSPRVEWKWIGQSRT